MDSRKIVFRQTAVIAVGELICSAVVVGVFAAFNNFSMTVLWSALCGCAVMIVNYFFIAVTVSLAADRAEKGEPEQAQKSVQLSSALRLACMAAVLVGAILLGANTLALLLPLLFIRPIVTLVQFFMKEG